MHKFRKDLTNIRFGRLVVQEYNYPNWKCLCDCGVVCNVRGHNLTIGNTKSCGCLRVDNGKRSKGLGKASMHSAFSHYRYGAKERGFSFELTEDQFCFITQQNCFYCNDPPSNYSNAKACHGGYMYSGIDRVDNTKGYTLDNCVACCKRCNGTKRAYSKQEFTDWIAKVYNNLKEKGELSI